MGRFVEDRIYNINDIVLPPSIKQLIQSYVDKKSIPHMFLTGTAGCGKSTIADALCVALGVKPMKINANDKNGVDMIRDTIIPYVKRPSLDTVYDVDGLHGFQKKIVILDEIENITPAFKEAFKGVVEQYEENAVFILTSNSIINFTAPLMSRFLSGYINFDNIVSEMDEVERKTYYAEIFKYIVSKLNVEYDDEVLTDIIDNFIPDIRSMLNECERLIDKYGNLLKTDNNHGYDVKSYLGMSLEKLTTECDKIKNKNLFYKNILHYIVSIGNEDAYLLISNQIEKFKRTYSKSNLPNLIILLKRIISRGK